MNDDKNKFQHQRKKQQIFSQTKQYTKINSYSQKPSFEQIFTLVLFLSQLTLHFLSVLRPIFRIDQILLYFMWALQILAIIPVFIDYFIITCGDPGDSLLISQENVYKWKAQEIQYSNNLLLTNHDITNTKSSNPYQVKFCKICKHTVKIKSYHCWSCSRCVEGIDHHCKFLNNCIGKNNYSAFFRLLSFSSLYFLFSIGVGIWVFYIAYENKQIDQLSFSKWIILTYSILSLVILVVIQILLWFHCYISCHLKISTVDYVFKKTMNKHEKTKSSDTERKNGEVALGP